MHLLNAAARWRRNAIFDSTVDFGDPWSVTSEMIK